MLLFLLLTSLISQSATLTKKVALVTTGDVSYNFFPLCTNYLEFNVSGTKDLLVILTNSYARERRSYEIVFGGWDNTKSVIRKDLEDKAKHEGRLVQNGVFQKYWVAVDDVLESVIAGKQNDKPLMYFSDPNYVKMNYFGVATGAGVPATWYFDSDILEACHCGRGGGRTPYKVKY